MSEWLKEHAWKACVGETLSRVRIPLSPPIYGGRCGDPRSSLGVRAGRETPTRRATARGSRLDRGGIPHDRRQCAAIPAEMSVELQNRCTYEAFRNNPRFTM